MKPSFIKMLDNSCLNLKELKEYIRVANESGTKADDIAKHLGVSVSSLRRFCRTYNVKIRNKEEQLNDLHKTLKGRKWTNEEAKKNVSEAVKKSYTKELRESRSNSNRQRWKNWDESKRKQVVMNGLVKMHKSRHSKRKRVVG